jgi:hypothetical protein
MPEGPVRWALRLHPRPWRDRYGDAIRDLSDELVEAGEASLLRLVIGLVVSAAREWFRVACQRPRRVVLSAAVVVAIMSGGTILHHLVSTSTPIAQSGPTVGGPITFKNGRAGGPDFVTVIGNGRTAGYMPISYLFQTNRSGSQVGGVAPVYTRDLHTLVGHEYPGVGFVPLGQSWASEPCVLQETTVEIAASGQMMSTPIACPSTLETMPNVVGSVTPTAIGMLSSESLTPEIKYERSASIAYGHIVSIEPAPGTKVHARTIVTVVSSLGAR